jgi:hypothetical protein
LSSGRVFGGIEAIRQAGADHSPATRKDIAMPLTRRVDFYDATDRRGVGRCNPVAVPRIDDGHRRPERTAAVMSVSAIEGSLRCGQ